MVTKQSIEGMISQASLEKQAHIIGRACMALFKRQTEDEKVSNGTKHFNQRGFTPADARQGSITAKYYIKHRALQDWQIAQWTKIESRGNMRIAKYWRQLAEEAAAKAAQTNSLAA